MKKINMIRIYLLLVILVWVGMIFSAATMLTFVGIDIWSIQQKFSDVQFRANGNNFMGSIFWLNAKNIQSWEVITINAWWSKTCFKQVKGIYYNAQRWNRLRPMDQDTLQYFKDVNNGNYEDLTLSGWLYTSCSGDEYSVYGQVTYLVSWNSAPTHLIAWVQYNRATNSMTGAFAKSLQRFDNKFPIGYIYDDAGWGIGFVWTVGNNAWAENDFNTMITKLNQWSWINNIFKYYWPNNSEIHYWAIVIDTTKWNAINTLMNAWVQWTIGLSFSVGNVEKNTILGNFDRKTLIFNALNVNFSKLINGVRKDAEDLCKGKYQYDADTIDFSKGNLFCIDFSSATNKSVTIEFNERSELKNKIIVVKNWDVRIESSMPVDWWPVNIFIDKGNLLIQNGTWNAVGFDKNGYPVPVGVTKWLNLKWNFIINGLVIWANSSRVKTGFQHKLFVNGKFASLNTPSYPSIGRTDQMTALFGSSVNNERIRLGKVFTRECNPITWSWSDAGWTPCNNSWDVNALLPLVIIDGRYPGLIK